MGLVRVSQAFQSAEIYEPQPPALGLRHEALMLQLNKRLCQVRHLYSKQVGNKSGSQRVGNQLGIAAFIGIVAGNAGQQCRETLCGAAAAGCKRPPPRGLVAPGHGPRRRTCSESYSRQGGLRELPAPSIHKPSLLAPFPAAFLTQ